MTARDVELRRRVKVTRVSVDPASMPDEVVLFSIPAIEATGGPVLEQSAHIESGKLHLVGGEVLVSRLNPRKSRVVMVPTDVTGYGVCSPEFIVLQPSSTLDNRFLSHWLTSEKTRQALDAAVRSVTRSHQRVEPDELMSLRLPALSLEEQRRIADFLDDQVARIDATITKRRTQLALASEWAASALTDAFGVHPTPDYLLGLTGDSLTLRRLGVRAISGGTPDSGNEAFWSDAGEGTPWVSISDMVEGGRVTSVGKHVTEQGMKAARLHATSPPTVLFAMYASLGKTSVSDVKAVWNQAILGMVPGEQCEAHFLLAWFEVIRPVLPALARSSTQDNFNAEQVMSLRIPQRTLREQRDLAAQRDRFKEHEQRLQSALTLAIERSEECKRSLITAAVTGELDVTTARPKVPA